MVSAVGENFCGEGLHQAAVDTKGLDGQDRARAVYKTV